jgi:4-hydroxythreonine-4-phosphate dehydrogenase
MKKNIIAVTMGDPAGIGPEIILKSFQKPEIWKRGVPVVVGDWNVLQEVRDRLQIDVQLTRGKNIDDLLETRPAVPVLDQEVVGDAALLPVGRVSPLGGKAAVGYVKKAVELALHGSVRGIATAPINKEALKAAGYQYIGHTEMLSGMSSKQKGMTMFMVDKLKIFFHTRHMSLRQVLENLTVEGVVETILTADSCLGSLGNKSSTLALAALNPHASDGGLFGDEEERVLIPARNGARGRGVDVEGPLPADSVFHLGLEGKFDAVVSLYHDQGHIAAKTYDFYRTVSVTFGLPFMRTSVDHGTAFDIAWKGRANPLSMTEAILACFDLSKRYTPHPLWV